VDDLTPYDPEQYQFVVVASETDLPDGERLYFDLDGEPVVLFRLGDRYYAIGDTCTHDNGPLGDGDLEGHEVICPRHGGRFDIRTGKATRLPAFNPTSYFPVRLIDGQIEVGIPK
jgi:3-phenylpropionate/trans-cinnamate dioxygenase ferredoxin subunit